MDLESVEVFLRVEHDDYIGFHWDGVTNVAPQANVIIRRRPETCDPQEPIGE